MLHSFLSGNPHKVTSASRACSCRSKLLFCHVMLCYIFSPGKSWGLLPVGAKEWAMECDLVRIHQAFIIGRESGMCRITLYCSAIALTVSDEAKAIHTTGAERRSNLQSNSAVPTSSIILRYNPEVQPCSTNPAAQTLQHKPCKLNLQMTVLALPLFMDHVQIRQQAISLDRGNSYTIFTSLR